MPIANIVKMKKMFYFLHFYGFACKNKLLSKQYSCNCSKILVLSQNGVLTTAPLVGFTQVAFSQSKNFEK